MIDFGLIALIIGGVFLGAACMIGGSSVKNNVGGYSNYGAE